MRYKKNEFCNTVIEGDYTYIINHDTGSHIKLRNGIWNNILFYVENDIEIDDSLKNIFEELCDNKVIVPNDVGKNVIILKI